MTESLDKPKKRVLGLTGNMWIYAFGVMGINLAIGLVNSYQAEFFDKIMRLNLVGIALIILAAKFISIVADFVIGNLIDRANFKAGKMRPWILFSAFPLFVFTMLSFAFIPFPETKGGEVGKYIYITFILILWNVSMTMADIPSQGMLKMVAGTPEDTNNAAGWANTLKSVALACSGVFITVVCMITGSGAVGWKEYLITAAILSGVGLILQLLMYFKGKEEYKVNASSAMSFKEMFRELKSNRMIQIVLVTYLLGFGRNIGLSIAVQASCIMIRDGIDLTKLGLGVMSGDACSWAIGLTSAISSMVTIILNPVINKKLGEKKYFIIAGFYGFAVSLISFLLYVLTPAETATGGVPFLRSIWAIWIYQFFLGFAYGPNGYLPMVMTADIVDYQEWKTGKRTEGTQFAILSMSNKLSNALSVSLGLLFIGAIGYSANSYADAVKVGVEIIDKKEVIVDAVAHTNAIHAAVPGSMQNKARAIYFLLPGLCMLASSLVMFFYKIDEKTKKQMREELALRRGEAREETVAENAVDALSEASEDFEVSEENDKTEE